MSFFAFIVMDKLRGALYRGQTDVTSRRAWEHRNRVIRGFTHNYYCTALVSFEMSEHAVARERQVRNWKRDWKIELMEACNPECLDLAATLI
jgi:putative endonuclease